MKVGDRVVVKNCEVYQPEGVCNGSKGFVSSIHELDPYYVNVELDWIDGSPVGEYLYAVNELEVIS